MYFRSLHQSLTPQRRSLKNSGVFDRVYGHYSGGVSECRIAPIPQFLLPNLGEGGSDSKSFSQIWVSLASCRVGRLSSHD